MAGPTASVILPQAIGDELRADIESEIQRMSTRVEGEDFWLNHRPFILIMDPDEFQCPHIAKIVGWTPRADIGFAAMCNRDEDHRLLGEICLYFARKMNGLVDFGGALYPPIIGEVNALWEKHSSGRGTTWDEWQPYFDEMMKGMRGTLYTVPTVERDWIYHVGDAEFLEFWLEHPNFRMVK